MRPRPFIGESALIRLACARCDHTEDPDGILSVCTACGGPLFPRYKLEREDLPGLLWDLPQRPANIWRYAELLPVRSPHRRITLGEGMTPLLKAPRLGGAIGLTDLWIKDEGRNPTGSFKARGMAVALCRAAELGIEAVTAPSAGNAGLALAVYAARLGMRALVAFPEDIPASYVRECRFHGAEVVVAGATIREAGTALRGRVAEDRSWSGAMDASTLREPYRLEGKKTMGYEIVEQLGGHIPDAIVYPTGGGTGLIGIWKAIEEMEALGWIPRGPRPRMICVQMAGCAPIVTAYRDGETRATPVAEAATRCWGLRVPAPYADREILRVLIESRGTAITVAEEELLPASRLAARSEGIDLAPEGAAALAALPRLLAAGDLLANDRIVVLNTAQSSLYK